MKKDVVHRRKLFGGRMTAEEVHQKYAFPPGAKCRCGRRPLIRAISMAPLADARRHWPELDVLASESPVELFKRLVELKGSDGKPAPFVRLGIAYACQDCRRDMERAMAKLPSWVLVEINRGPGTDRPLVAVPS